MLNIVVPMAGSGIRFAEVGYKDPKPLIPVHGVPMIRWVIENLRPSMPHRYIFICQRAHVSAYGLEEKLKAWAPCCVLIQLDGVTEGAACTVLTAREYIDNNDPMMIANSDQYADVDMDTYLAEMDKQNLGALIMTLKVPPNDARWSFVGFDSKGNVDRVVEKETISDEATVGIYNYRHGKDFVKAAEAMIAANLRVKGEFYVAPVFNQLIAQGQRIGVYNIGSPGKGMYGMGTPPDLEAFLALPLSREIVKDLT
ncbi:MAG TPA: glycosyltransferase family 2 protein [Alphaproteobacteria bacterium]|nr:glycosyltransferase family 2 protein [Alphaproteobacteria bacterium]